MKTTHPFLRALALGSASLALALHLHSDEGAKAKSEISESPKKPAISAGMTKAVNQAVNQQVLAHLNPQPSLADRMSRVLRPKPSHYYELEIAGKPKSDSMVPLRIVHVRNTGKKPTRTLFTTGFYEKVSGQVFLFDPQKKKNVPAFEHSAIKKGKSV